MTDKNYTPPTFACGSCGKQIRFSLSICPHCQNVVSSADIAKRPGGSASDAEGILGCFVGLALVGAAAYFLISFIKSPVEQYSEKPKRNLNSSAPIEPGVFEPYERSGWKSLFAEWGPKGVARIQRLREAAARKVAQNPACDVVESSEIATMRSTPPNSPVVFVDCRNTERFYVSEKDLSSDLSSEMEKGARFSSSELIEKCTSSLRNKLSLPTTLDRNWFSVSERQGTSGNRVVDFEFTAKSPSGVSLSAKAKCIMTTEGNFELEIIE
jgi:hypothetical protein